MHKDLPPPELLRKVLRHEPETGKLFWMPRTPDMFNTGKRDVEKSCKIWNSCWSGAEALKSPAHGYFIGSIFGKIKYAHRVIWAIHYGSWPSGQIDHINGDGMDNLLVNLRDVSMQDNNRNKRINVNNTSGHLGVVWNKSGAVWHSRIKVLGKFVHLGSFHRKEDAIDARKSAEAEYGFHKNHGRETR